MRGRAYIDKKWFETDDRSQVETTMALLAELFRNIEAELDLGPSAEALEQLLTRFGRLADHWNRNIEFLAHLDRLEQIREIKAVLSGLRWPPDGAPGEASS